MTPVSTKVHKNWILCFLWEARIRQDPQLRYKLPITSARHYAFITFIQSLKSKVLFFHALKNYCKLRQASLHGLPLKDGQGIYL